MFQYAAMVRSITPYAPAGPSCGPQLPMHDFGIGYAGNGDRQVLWQEPRSEEPQSAERQSPEPRWLELRWQAAWSRRAGTAVGGTGVGASVGAGAHAVKASANTIASAKIVPPKNRFWISNVDVSFSSPSFLSESKRSLFQAPSYISMSQISALHLLSLPQG